MNRILYRLPNTCQAHEITCQHPLSISDLTEIGETAGYIFAPFDIQGQHPTLLFPAETQETWEIPDASTSLHLSYTDNTAESLKQYSEAFGKSMEYLQQSIVEKIVLSRTWVLQFSAPLSLAEYRQLFVAACHGYPHSFVSLIFLSDHSSWLIATPEVLLETVPEGFHTMALAATMSIEEAAGRSPETWSPKDCEEQQIVSRYIHHQLLSLGLNPTVSALQTLTAGQVVHLCTHFTMPSQLPVGSIIRTLHPTPAVCGHPTVTAAKILQEVEPHDRAYYAGFSGPVGLSCGTHLYVTLRCMQILGETATLYAGGGLLPASVCQTEWTETVRKMKTMLHVLR